MSTLTLEQALQMAVAHHNAGQLPQAEAIYRQILAVQPNNPDALHLLGVIANQVGQPSAAVELIAKAIAIQPGQAAFHTNLGEAYRALGQLDEAIACYRRALAMDPGSAPAHFQLGALLHSQNRIDEAIACYQKALALQPDHAQAHSNLGLAWHSQGQETEAIACYRQALEINPASPEAHYNLGIALLVQKQSEEAVRCFQQAVALRPDYGEAWNNLGAALFNSGRFDEAVSCFERALMFQPDNVEVCYNLGNIFRDQGRIEEALKLYREVVRLMPNDPTHLSTLLLALNLRLNPGDDAGALLEEHQQWNQRFAVPLRSAICPHPNDPDPNRRLKIGYVSPDFRVHACGHFLAPLFASHDHTQVQIYCYANVRKPDQITQQLKQGADVWRDVLALSDEELAEQIRQDGIDILVDLSLHMVDNRLLVFARKPAPVQVSWLGYPETTGVETIDYRLTDAYLQPPQHKIVLSSEQASGEQAIRLPDSFWCYDPLSTDPAVNELPALGGSPLTFGSLNHFCKVSQPALALWAHVLSQVPEARLLLLAEPGNHREQAREYLQALGIAGQRVEFVGRCQRQPYLRLYHQVDIMLDTIPCNGHTTSLDALWMGVPVVTVAGRTGVGRGGVSILSNVGLPELIARTEDEYINIAVDLANDLPRLAELRATMRARMQASPLMDGPRFARGMEAAYRQMWHNWCEGRTLK